MGSPSQARVLTRRASLTYLLRLLLIYSHTSKWRGDKDLRRPSALAPTSSRCSPRDRSRSSRTLSVPSASPSQTATLPTCWARPPAQSTSHRWSLSSLRRWPVAHMTTTPSSNHLMHSIMTWGDKFSGQEVDEAFAEFVIEDGQIDAA